MIGLCGGVFIYLVPLPPAGGKGVKHSGIYPAGQRLLINASHRDKIPSLITSV